MVSAQDVADVPCDQSSVRLDAKSYLDRRGGQAKRRQKFVEAARTNDEGWPTIFVEWLRVSRLRPEDLILVLSVGGGSLEKNVSPNLVTALQYAQEVGTPVIGIVGKDGGYTAKVAAACAVVPTVNPDHITPHSEAFQAVIWHLLVSHPRVKTRATKWESVK